MWLRLLLPLARLAHVPRLFRPRRCYRSPIARPVVLHRGQSPTTDIYLRPRLAHLGARVRYVDILEAPGPAPLQDGDFVIIVRYLNPRWAYALLRARPKLSGVAYFLDDDIPAAPQDRNLPRDYVAHLTVFWAALRPALARLASELWVTSDALADKYAAAAPQRIDPLYLDPDGMDGEPGCDPHARSPVVRVFYHGGRTHELDTLWVSAVARKVQARSGGILFEVFGDGRVAAAFREIPRCRVLHPMKWPAYRDYTAAVELDIGLSPLTAGAYNAGRSHNKVFDITRAGAAGIFADAAPFNRVIEHDRTGLLIARNDTDAWAEAILELAHDPERRRRLHTAARAMCRRLTRQELETPLLARFRCERG